jgi:hypothetical protein
MLTALPGALTADGIHVNGEQTSGYVRYCIGACKGAGRSLDLKLPHIRQRAEFTNSSCDGIINIGARSLLSFFSFKV